MLSEKVFAIEFITFAFDGALWAGRAAVISEAEMLRGNMTLPFILRAECAGTASEGESTGEWSSMCSSDVFPEGGRVFEGCMAA